jgi:hypothetical protein
VREETERLTIRATCGEREVPFLEHLIDSLSGDLSSDNSCVNPFPGEWIDMTCSITHDKQLLTV